MLAHVHEHAGVRDRSRTPTSCHGPGLGDGGGGVVLGRAARGDARRAGREGMVAAPGHEKPVGRVRRTPSSPSAMRSQLAERSESTTGVPHVRLTERSPSRGCSITQVRGSVVPRPGVASALLARNGLRGRGIDPTCLAPSRGPRSRSGRSRHPAAPGGYDWEGARGRRQSGKRLEGRKFLRVSALRDFEAFCRGTPRRRQTQSTHTKQRGAPFPVSRSSAPRVWHRTPRTPASYALKVAMRNPDSPTPGPGALVRSAHPRRRFPVSRTSAARAWHRTPPYAPVRLRPSVHRARGAAHPPPVPPDAPARAPDARRRTLAWHRTPSAREFRFQLSACLDNASKEEEQILHLLVHSVETRIPDVPARCGRVDEFVTASMEVEGDTIAAASIDTLPRKGKSRHAPQL